MKLSIDFSLSYMHMLKLFHDFSKILTNDITYLDDIIIFGRILEKLEQRLLKVRKGKAFDVPRYVFMLTNLY